MILCVRGGRKELSVRYERHACYFPRGAAGCDNPLFGRYRSWPAVPILCKGAVMKFGFTNDKAEYDRVVAFRMAAIADGWTLAPIYEHEPAESHATMSRDGFKAHVKARIKQPGEKWKYETEVSLWGPDGLHIPTPEVYSMDTLVEALRVCPKCKAKDVDTVRYSFAGRCCNVCLPEMRRRHEYPGWAS